MPEHILAKKVVEKTSKKVLYQIFIRYHLGNRIYFKYSTGEKFYVDEWNIENKEPYFLSSRKKEHQHIKENWSQVNRYIIFLKQLITDFKLTGETISKENLKKHFDLEFKNIDISKQSDFIENYEEFLEERKTAMNSAANTLKRYITFQNLIQTFSKESKYKLSYENINDSFYNRFLGYCRTEKVKTIGGKKKIIPGHQNNTIGRNISILKTFMAWANKRGYTNNKNYLDFKQPKNESVEIALTYNELISLYEYDFKIPYLIKARDLFCFGAFTGLRYSDFSRVEKRNISNNTIIIKEKKNGKRLEVPLNRYSKDILLKYDYQLPIISNQKLNVYIKKAGEIAEINEDIEKTISIGKDDKTTSYKKYQLIGTHTARRTFVTIAINSGVQPDVVMKITGHKKLVTLYNSYVKTPDEKAVSEMNRVFGEPEKSLK